MTRIKIECCCKCTPETGRHPGCHATCGRYKEERAELDRDKSERKKDFPIKDYLFNVETNHRDRQAKKRRSKSWSYKK